MNQRAVLAVAGQNDRAAIRAFQRHRSDVQPQPGLGLGTAVARIAGCLEDRLHLGGKVDGWCGQLSRACCENNGAVETKSVRARKDIQVGRILPPGRTIYGLRRGVLIELVQ